MRVFIAILLLTIHISAATLYYIDFVGNKTFSKERLYKELGFEKSLYQKIFFKKLRPRVSEKLLPSLQEELKLFYQEQGFFDAKISLTIKENRAIFIIKENEPLHIAYISIQSDFPINVPFKKKERFIIGKFVQMKKDIKKKLLQAGYCSAEADIKAYVYKKSKKVYIVIRIDKGNICTIASIKIYGLKTLPKKVVLSHIYMRPGEKFSLQKIEESYKRLYSLQYFNQVRFDYSKKIHNSIFLDIYLKERTKYHIYKAGLGYESQQGGTLSLEYNNINFHSHQIKTKLAYAKLKKESFISLFTPSLKFFDNYFDMTHKIAYTYNSFESFKSKEARYDLRFLQDRFSHSYSLGVSAQRVTIFDSTSCIHDNTYNLIFFTGKLFIDRRDSKIFPTHGFFASTSFESSIKTLSSSNYIKLLVEAGVFYPLQKAIIFAKAKLGEIFSDGTLPPSKYFIAGGVQSNRAYGYREIFALDSSCQKGGKSLLAATLEFRYPIKSFYGALFWDRTYVSRLNFSFKNFVDGVGLGALYPTKIGTIKLYFGFNPSDIAQNQLSMYIGAAF